jgi:hypothetical protein
LRFAAKERRSIFADRGQAAWLEEHERLATLDERGQSIRVRLGQPAGIRQQALRNLWTATTAVRREFDLVAQRCEDAGAGDADRRIVVVRERVVEERDPGAAHARAARELLGEGS